MTPKRRPPAQKIHPIGFLGRREAIKAPTVGNVKANKEMRTGKLELNPGWLEKVRKPSTPLNAAKGKESAHTDHASQAAVRRLIPPTPRSCSLAPSVTTPLYRTIVSQALRQPLRGHIPREYLPA